MSAKPLALQLGEFVAALRFDALPPVVVDKAKALLNHGVTISMAGFASARSVAARTAVLQHESLGLKRVGGGEARLYG